jgi:hypothetical protein
MQSSSSTETTHDMCMQSSLDVVGAECGPDTNQ